MTWLLSDDSAGGFGARRRRGQMWRLALVVCPLEGVVVALLVALTVTLAHAAAGAPPARIFDVFGGAALYVAPPAIAAVLTRRRARRLAVARTWRYVVASAVVTLVTVVAMAVVFLVVTFDPGGPV